MLDRPEASARVTVWRDEVLPNSETFIVNQARAMRRYRPQLAGLRATPNTLGAVANFTLEGSPTPAHRADRWFYWRTGTSPRLHRQLRGTAVVHAHFGPDATHVVRAARLARRPLLVTFHGYDATVAPAELGVDYGALFRGAARLVAVSDFIRRRLVGAGAPEGKIAVRHIGIPVPPDRPRPVTIPQLLFVGRLVEKKGCADLLRIMSGMADAPPLRIIGDGPLRSELEGLAEQLRVNARFVGGQGPDAVAAAMRASTALCVPSRTATNGDEEGLPMVVLEAAAHRLPLIAYTAGGIAEAVTDGETGFVLAQGDTAGFARRVQAVLGDDELAQRLGGAARRRLEQSFEINDCTARLEDLYDEVSPGATR